jgi:hypothetical protein
MHYWGSHPLSGSLLPLLNSNSQVKIFITNGRHLRIRTILQSKIIFSKTVQVRSSRAVIFLLRSNKRIATLTITIIQIRRQIQITTINEEAIRSSKDHNNMITLIMEIWLPHQPTQVTNRKREDRVETIHIREAVPTTTTPAIIMVEAPQQYRRAIKVYLLSTMLHKQRKMRYLLLNRQILKQLEESNRLTTLLKHPL